MSDDVYADVVRLWERAGGALLSVVSVCHTERGAKRVAAKTRLAEIEESADGKTFTVWGVPDDE